MPRICAVSTDDSSATPSLRSAWNVGGIVGIFFPLLVLFLDRTIKRRKNDNESPAWGWQEGQAGAILISYLWSLLLFIALIVYGNVLFKKKRGDAWYYKPFNDTTSEARHVGILTGAVAVFANMALVLFFVIGSLLVSLDEVHRVIRID